MRRITTLLVLFAAAGCARPSAPVPPPSPVPTAPAPPARALPSLDRDALRRDLGTFTSDSFMGRRAGTRHALLAANFIASRLAEIGIEPKGDSGYLQRVPLSRQALASATSITIISAGRTTTLRPGQDLFPLISLGEMNPLPRLEADGELVFVGYGLKSAELNRDDLAGLTLAGKVVVLIGDAPPGLDSMKRAQIESDPGFGARIGSILNQQPAAIVVLGQGRAAGQLKQVGIEQLAGELSLGERAPERPRLLPMLLVGDAKAGSPLLPSGWPRDDRAQSLQGRRFRARVELRRDTVVAYNVVGVLRGSDPAAANSYVALGAHLDHIGVQPPVDGDSIANGADDDGSGSMALVAAARALTTAGIRPRRSLLFVWHTGEEGGLLGSEWFTSHPTVPLDSIVAQLNADMIGRNAPDSLYLVGPRAAPSGQSRVLGLVVDSVNATLARPFLVNREWDDPNHPEQIYRRSDHFSYAKRGIPIVFFTTGLHADYHKVSDELPKIDLDKLARVGELIMRSAVAVGDRATRPK